MKLDKQRRPFFFLALVAAGVIFIISVATERTLRVTSKNALEHFGHNQCELAAAAAGSLEDFLSYRLALLSQAAENASLFKKPDNMNAALEEIYEKGGGLFSVVYAVDASGHVACSYPPAGSAGGIAGDLPPERISSPPTGDVNFSMDDPARASARAAVPFSDDEKGALVALVDMAYVTAYAEKLGQRLGRDVFLFNRDWRLVFHRKLEGGVESDEKGFWEFLPKPEVRMDGFTPLSQIESLSENREEGYLAYAPVKLPGNQLIFGVGVSKTAVSGFLVHNPAIIIGMAGSRVFAVLVCVGLFYIFDKRRLRAKEEAHQLREEQKLLVRLEESEERYKTLVENLLSAVVIFQDGHIKFVNHMFCSMTKYSEEEVTGENFDLFSLIHENDRPLVHENIGRVLDGERLDYPREIRYVKKNGEIIEGLTLSSTINFGGKRAIETVVVDVTRVKEIEGELKATKRRLQYLLDNAPIMIFSLDQDGAFSYLNKETLRVTGYGQEQIGESFAPIVHPDDLALAVSKFDDGRKGIPRRDYHLRIRNAAGETRILHLIADTILEDKTFKGSLLIASDITEQQRLQQTIKETRDHLANIIENAGDSIITVDTAGNIVSWNKTAESMFRFVEPYAFHKPLHLLLNTNAAQIRELIEQTACGNTIRDIEVECLRNGAPLDTLFTFSPIRNASGEVIGISCFAKDITERRNLEKHLERDKQFIDQLIENANALIAAVNEKGKIAIFNRRFEEVSGYAKEEALGQDPLELMVPQQHREAVAEKIRTLREDKPLLEIEIPIIAKDGRLLMVTWNVAAVRLPIGLTGAIVVGQDVTGQKKMQEELIQSKKLASIGELVSGVAHELNNPLTIIMGYAQLLISEKTLEDKHREKAQKVMDAAVRSKRIVENLLAFARKKKLQKQEVNINEILESTLMLREHNLTVNNIRLVRRFEEGLPLVYADGHQLQQVFLNLINNAFDAMFEANHKGTLEVTTCRNEKMIAIEFVDDGPGVPESIQDKIFDPFFTTKEVGKGTGLGMSLSYGIVNEHGGRIFLDCAYRAGAKFVVELPINQTAPAPLPAQSSQM
jgi:PAS domain S-box-containing protein